jgi:hypothetical protein
LTPPQMTPEKAFGGRCVVTELSSVVVH